MRAVTSTPPTRERSRVDGVHYTVTGDGPGTVVLLHGYCDNLTTWNRVVPRLAVDNRVIAIDLPGFGRSTRRWRPALVDNYVDVVNEVLAAESAGLVSFVGNSMGAVVSAAFAARYPLRTDRVVLIDMPGLRGVPHLWRLALSRPAELGLRGALRLVGEAPARFGLGYFYAHVACGTSGRFDPLARDGFGAPFTAKGSVPAVLPIGRALLRDLARLDLGTLVGELSAPTLLVFGSRDMLTPARVLRRVGRDGGAVVIPRCGHCPQIDQPDALLAAVSPFLDGQDATARIDRTRAA